MIIKCPNPNCGAPNDDSDAFCTRCGEPLKLPKSKSSKIKCPNPKCGAENDASDTYCTACGTKLKRPEQVTKSGPKTPSKIELLYGMQTAEGEKPIKQYYCSELKIPDCKGYLTVTNKRVVFQGKGNGASRISQEIPIDSVGGIYCGYGTFVRWGLLLIAAILVIASIIAITEGYDIGVVGLVPATILAVLSFKHRFTLEIKSAKAVGTGISVGIGGNGVIGNTAEFAVVGLAASDTDKMLNELGALVQDIQTMGDYAIEKWSKK